MKRILLTGATSFIGRVLCRSLRDSGNEVYALIRPESPSVCLFHGEPGITTVLGGMDSLKSALDQIAALDAIIHLAWDGVGAKGRADAGIQKFNFERSMALIRLGADVGCRLFVGAGSQSEYGVISNAITEETPCNPGIEYGKAKLRFTNESRDLCARLGIQWRMPRIFSVYGPEDHPWALVPSLLKALAAKKAMPLTDCRQYWNFLYVDDAARALETLADPALEDGIYNVASACAAPLKEFVMKVCARFPNSPMPLFGAVPHGPGGALSLQPSVEKLRSTGWRETITFEQGIEKTIRSIFPGQTTAL